MSILFRNSYSLTKIINWLNKNNLNKYEYNCSLDSIFTKTGIHIKLNEKYSLSIQTHPTIAGSSFCETALIDNITGKPIYNVLNYYDVIRHNEPENLFEHLLSLKEDLKI